jgi:3-phosphoshikimate 1-carboxyvinyltransferase
MNELIVKAARSLQGTITVPGDKSISHRVLLLGAIARGLSRATGFLPAADCLSTLGCLAQMGVPVERPDETTVLIQGLGLRGWTEPAGVLDCGNSGTTMRLLAGLLAGQGFYAVLTGDASLRRRPMARIAEPLRRLGATVLGRQGGSLPPLTIWGGNLHGIEYTPPVASAQVKSCLLLAALYAAGPTTIHEPVPSRDHTERMLLAQGAAISLPATKPAEGTAITLQPQTRPLEPLNIAIPGDVSSAAFFVVAASIVPGSWLRIQGVGTNPTRTGILDVLADMGGSVVVENERSSGGEPLADLVIQAAPLRGVDIAGALIPRLIDELPVIAVAATQAQGVTTVHEAAELRAKESDRISALVTELRKLGAKIAELPDGFVVEGPSSLHGAVVGSHGDHRLAMSLAIAGLVAKGETTILGAEAIAVSFPGFEQTLEGIVS